MHGEAAVKAFKQALPFWRWGWITHGKLRCLLVIWQDHCKTRANTNLALNEDMAVVLLDNGFNNGKAQPCPPLSLDREGSTR